MARTIWAFLVAALLSAAPPLAFGGEKGAPVSGVLLVTLDTTRADYVGVYGQRRRLTPNIDRMARRGAVFTWAFSHNPMTLPAHANIMTGQTALFHGVADNNGFRLDERFPTLAERARDLGYATAAFVSSFVLDHSLGLDRGFDLYREPTTESTFLAATSVAAARRWIGEQKGKWFCWLHLWDPHFPYEPPAPFAARYASDPYAGEVAYMDDELGKLFSFLEGSGRLGSTLLVITGDHGEALGDHGENEHGFFAYNSTVHVPLIVCLPGERPRIVTALVSHVDLFPTVCGAMGSEPPAGLAGRSLLPLVAGGSRPERPVYIESKGPHLTKGWAPLEGFISGGMKYIDLPIKELYDLRRDFAETRNIISSRKLSELNGELAELKKSMSGADTAAARATLSADAVRKLRAFGYLAGLKFEKKAVYTRADDLKTLLPLQNKLLRANQLFNQRKYQEARALYEEVIASRPDDISSYAHLANTLHFLNQPQEAVDVLRRGLARRPDNPELKAKLGVFLTDVNRFDEAASLLREVLDADPGNAENWNFLGVALFRMKRFPQAQEAYEKALALDPANVLALSNLGSLLLSRHLANRDPGTLERALAVFDRAIELDDRSVAALNGRGAALKFAGQRERALADWRRLLELQPDFIDAHFNIAVTLLDLGRRKEAGQCLRQLQEEYGQRLSVRDRESLQRLLHAAREGE